MDHSLAGGAGGAPKIKKIAAILENLRYQKIVAIFDGDKGEENKKFQKRFPTYKAFIIPTDDIRDKKALEKPAKDGMMTENGLLLASGEINHYGLTGNNHSGALGSNQAENLALKEVQWIFCRMKISTCLALV